jgi:hypothetical protein
MPTAADEYDLRNVERERRKREDELLLLLLLTLSSAEHDAQTAAVHGFAVAPVLQNVIGGNPFTGHRGVAPTLARGMAKAHRTGYRRAGLMVGTTLIERSDAGTLEELIDQYTPQAEAAAAAMVATLTDETVTAVARARVDGGDAKAVRLAVVDAFVRTGYDRSNPYALDLGVERAVVSAHNGGIISGAVDYKLAPSVTGLRHVSVLDSQTTEICQQRNGLQLPVTHPYWHFNCPSLHPRCRSVLRILTGRFTPSETLPTEPPFPGWGAAPVGFLEGLMRIA